jgi:DNA-binding XRE family transcriptional regulator
LEKQTLAQAAGFSNKEYGLKERESDRAEEELGLKIKDSYFENFSTQLQDASPEEQVQLIDALLLDREADEY